MSDATVSTAHTLMAKRHQVKQDNCHAPEIAISVNDGIMSRRARRASYRDVQAQIGQRLRWVREIIYPNRAEFAREIGLDRTTVQKIEDGDRAPSVFNVLEFCHALHVSPNYLLLGSMQGMDGELAAALAARHPELAHPLPPSSGSHNPGRASGGGSALPARKSPARRRAAA